KRLQLWKCTDGQCTDLTFSQDNKTLAAAYINDRSLIRLLDVTTGKELRRFPGFGPLAFSTDGKLLAAGDRDKGHLLDVSTGKEIARRNFPRRLVAVSAAGNKLLALGENG